MGAVGAAAEGLAAGQNGGVARKPVHADPRAVESGGDGAKHPDRRRQATLVGIGMAVILLVWFAVANVRDVRIEFWVFHRQAPLILVIVISGLLGALIAALALRRKPKGGAE
jgi:uncharacterized integral membrane protein